MKNAVLVFSLILLMTSCEFWDPAGIGDPNYHLSSDEVGFLVFKPDTIPSDGMPRVYFEKATYLLNGKDTVIIDVVTDVYFSDRNPNWILSGNTSLDFKAGMGFDRAVCYVEGDTALVASFMYLELSITNAIKDYFRNLTFKTGSAVVLGKQYQDVYECVPVSWQMKENLVKSVLYAKKYGFIRIETIEGKTLELIRINSDNS